MFENHWNMELARYAINRSHNTKNDFEREKNNHSVLKIDPGAAFLHVVFNILHEIAYSAAAPAVSPEHGITLCHVPLIVGPHGRNIHEINEISIHNFSGFSQRL